MLLMRHCSTSKVVFSGIVTRGAMGEVLKVNPQLNAKVFVDDIEPHMGHETKSLAGSTEGVV